MAMEIELPNDENGDVLRRMLAAGDNLSAPRDINFSAILPDEKSARLYAERIVPHGYPLHGPTHRDISNSCNCRRAVGREK